MKDVNVSNSRKFKPAYKGGGYKSNVQLDVVNAIYI